MPKTNISTILINGTDTKIETIDYSLPERIEQLKRVKEKADIALNNKFVSQFKLSRIIIKQTTNG